MLAQKGTGARVDRSKRALRRTRVKLNLPINGSLRAALPEIKEQLFWFGALIGLAPALAANTLIPTYWYVQYLMPDNVPPVIGNPFPYLSIIVFVYMLWYCIQQRSYAKAISLAPYLVFWLIGRGEFAGFEAYIYFAYSFVSFTSFVNWLTNTSMRKLYVLVFVLLLAAFSYYEPVFGSFQILEFLFYSLMFKIVVQFVLQNIDIFRSLGLAKTTRLLAIAARYWSFMLIPLGIGLWLHFAIESAVENTLYDARIVITPPPPETVSQEEWGREFRRDLDYTVDSHFNRSQAEVDRAVSSMKLQSGELKETFPDDVAAEYNDMVPERLVDPDSCTGLTSPLCRGVLDLVNEGFDRFRTRQRENLRGKATEIAGDADRTTQKKLDDVQAEFSAVIANTRRAVKAIIRNSFRLAGFVNLLLNFILLFAVIKSILIVLARVIFKKENALFVSVSEFDGRMAKGDIRVPREAHKYSIPKSRKAVWYNNTRVDWSGPEQQKAVPQWRSCALARFSTGTYLMNRMKMGQPDSTGAIFSTGRDNQFVEWTLKKNEEVIFDFGYLVAMTDTVKIKTVFSLKLSTLLLGKIFYSCATGPGKLVLMTGGDAIAGKTRHAGLPVAASRLVAWHRQARFEILANLSMIDTYTSEVSIQKRPADLIVINSRSKSYGTFGQLWRFIKVFIMPF